MPGHTSAPEIPARLRVDVNLSILFTDLPLLRRPAAAAAEGFDAVELWWPFDRAVPSRRESADLVDAIGSAGLTLACLNLPAGDFAAGERGWLSVAARTPDLVDGAAAALEIARPLGCRAINALYGNRLADVAAEAQRWVAVANLRRVAALAAADGVTIVVEALNADEYPDYGLHAIDEAAALIASVESDSPRGAASPRLLFDAYHIGRGRDDVVEAWERVAPLVGHVQVADVPGRRRPGSGTLPFERLFEAVDRSAYAGFVGLEFLASADPPDTFGWLRRPGRRS